MSKDDLHKVSDIFILIFSQHLNTFPDLNQQSERLFVT